MLSSSVDSHDIHDYYLHGVILDGVVMPHKLHHSTLPLINLLLLPIFQTVPLAMHKALAPCSGRLDEDSVNTVPVEVQASQARERTAKRDPILQIEIKVRIVDSDIPDGMPVGRSQRGSPRPDQHTLVVPVAEEEDGVRVGQSPDLVIDLPAHFREMEGRWEAGLVFCAGAEPAKGVVLAHDAHGVSFADQDIRALFVVVQIDNVAGRCEAPDLIAQFSWQAKEGRLRSVALGTVVLLAVVLGSWTCQGCFLVTYTSIVHTGVFLMLSKPFFNFLTAYMLWILASANSVAKGFKALTPLRTLRCLKIILLNIKTLGDVYIF
ncbi:hypothetical protein PMIN02_011776 [Paraphaeosphaeria minitans]